MKAFKIKKRSHKQATFIIGPSVTSFPKPKLPLFYFTKIHRPSITPAPVAWVVQEEAVSPVVEPEALLPVSYHLWALVERSATLLNSHLLPASPS
jgi:hypothetical protein